MSMQQLTPSQVLQERAKALARANSWKRLAASLVCTLVCTLLLFGLIFGVAIVHGSSMNPAFRENDLVLFSRLGRCSIGGRAMGSYGVGDVVILKADRPEPQGPPPDARGLRKYVKRVIGVPGDTVDINSAGGVLVNGEPPCQGRHPAQGGRGIPPKAGGRRILRAGRQPRKLQRFPQLRRGHGREHRGKGSGGAAHEKAVKMHIFSSVPPNFRRDFVNKHTFQ